MNADLTLRVSHRGIQYILEELDTGIESESKDGYWGGYITLACYTDIGDNQAFREAVEVMLLNGFANRIMGGNMRLLRSLNIRRRLTAAEKAQYGEGVKSLIKIGYRAYRDWVKGEVVLENGQHVIKPTEPAAHAKV
jgi:hypothetical protein